MSWTDAGLLAVIAIPLAVVLGMIFWPSGYSAPPPIDPQPTRPPPVTRRFDPTRR